MSLTSPKSLARAAFRSFPTPGAIGCRPSKEIRSRVVRPNFGPQICAQPMLCKIDRFLFASGPVCGRLKTTGKGGVVHWRENRFGAPSRLVCSLANLVISATGRVSCLNSDSTRELSFLKTPLAWWQGELKGLSNKITRWGEELQWYQREELGCNTSGMPKLTCDATIRVDPTLVLKKSRCGMKAVVEFGFDHRGYHMLWTN